jgi:molybdenum cofactor biosynthesis protein MoaC
MELIGGIYTHGYNSFLGYEAVRAWLRMRNWRKMVDVTNKPPVFRTATASGAIRLKRSSVEAIKEGQIKKGDVLTTARLAAILAVKDTPRIIPMCHNIPITGVKVELEHMRRSELAQCSPLSRW